VSRTDEIFYQITNDKKPRYVELSFKPPKKFNRIKELRNSRLVSENIDSILVEGGTTNSEFTSFELTDTGAEKHLYDTFNSSVFITEIADPKDSPQDNYKKLIEAQSDGALTGQEKKLISSALKGIQSQGYKLAKSDISAEDAESAKDLTSRQNFSIQINNLIFGELVESTLRLPDSLFQDEFAKIQGEARRRSTSAKFANRSNSTSETNYTQELKPIGISYFQAQASSLGTTPGHIFTAKENDGATASDHARPAYPKIFHAGYIIKKLEITGNDKYEDRGMLISDNPDGLFIIDENVRYGGVYVYEIRSVYLVEMIAEVRVEGDASLDRVAAVKTLVASEGRMISVNCVETLPPPPPTNLRVSFNFTSRKPFLTWQFPINPQRDIKRFQIFKRMSVEEPFTLIKEYDFDNSTIRTNVAEVATEDRILKFASPRISFTDNEWSHGQKPIYSIACVDAHGLTSNYGSQIQFEFNPRSNKYKNTLISYPNAPKPYPNLLLNSDAFQDAIKVSGYDRMRIFFDPEYYKVTKLVSDGRTRSSESQIVTEQDQNFIRIDKDNDTYKIHIINLDLQKDKTLGIRVGDFSGSPLDTVSSSTFNLNSINI
jgi:hypothetical protein